MSLKLDQLRIAQDGRLMVALDISVAEGRC